MKTSIIKNLIVSFTLTLISATIHSQTCTQCDNTGNPLGTLASEIGQNTTAQGECSFAGGVNSIAEGGYSFAFGNTARTLGHHCIALGGITTADGSSSFALGKHCTANGSSTFTLGSGMSSSIILSNSISNSLVIGFNSDRPTLFVGESEGIGKTGKVGIGNVTNPDAKLHIKADDGYTTEVLVQWSNNNMANLWLGTTAYGLKASTNKLEFKVATGGKYVFNDGNLGIGTLTPTEKLEVAGNVKITSGYTITSKVQAIDNKGLSLTNTGGTGITIANDGRVGIGTITAPTEKLDVNGKVKSTSLQITTGFANGKLLQSDPSGNAIWTDPAWTISGSNVYRVAAGYVGIGTFSPSEKLDIIGTVKATSMYTNTGILIVGKDNYSGTDLTEITDPQFEVRSSSEINRKSANFVDSEGRRIFFVPKIYNGYNPIASIDDAGIFWSDSQAQGSNQNEFSGFVIGPHRDGAAKGIKIDKDGKVGIGKAVPIAMLDVNGDVLASELTVNSITATALYGDPVSGKFIIYSKLEAPEIEVKSLSEWKDCVFENNYKLMSLKETEEFIKLNKHLPGIPSEKEVLENGINVGEMNALLLQKIEELTLYVIELEKKIEEKR